MCQKMINSLRATIKKKLKKTKKNKLDKYLQIKYYPVIQH